MDKKFKDKTAPIEDYGRKRILLNTASGVKSNDIIIIIIIAVF